MNSDSDAILAKEHHKPSWLPVVVLPKCMPALLLCVCLVFEKVAGPCCDERIRGEGHYLLDLYGCC